MYSILSVSSTTPSSWSTADSQDYAIPASTVHLVRSLGTVYDGHHHIRNHQKHVELRPRGGHERNIRQDENASTSGAPVSG